MSGKNTYSVTAKNVKNDCSEVIFGKSDIIFDSGKNRNLDFIGPAELLCSSFAACTLKNVSRFSEMLPFQYEYAEVEVIAERHDSPPSIEKIFYRLKIKTNEDDHRVELLHTNIKKFGTIFNTLAKALHVEGEIIKI